MDVSAAVNGHGEAQRNVYIRCNNTRHRWKMKLYLKLYFNSEGGTALDIIKKARKMGFTQAEIDEAVWMSIAFGGAPVMMFYQEVMKT